MTITEAKEKLLNVARGEIGYHEIGDNYTKYAEGMWDNQFYGWELQNQPWCDMFVDWCFCQAFGIQKGAAMTYQTVGSGSALCSTSASYYQSHGAFSYTPEVGDQVFFYAGGGINHTGIVESVEGGQVHTIEGNTSDSVRRRTYSLSSSELAGFGHPNWNLVADGSEDNTPSTPDTPNAPADEPLTRILRKGDVGPDVRAAQEKLIAAGYSCGPDGADGEFGINTLDAVIKFQIDKNLVPVDGEIGPDTWNALNNATPNTNKNTNFAVGDIVNFIGHEQFVNGINMQPKVATPGKARITQISRNKNIKHPYHIIHTTPESNVYGWVDEGTIEKV